MNFGNNPGTIPSEYFLENKFPEIHICSLEAPGRSHIACCIQYLHKDPGVMFWAATGYTTQTSLVLINSNLNADGTCLPPYIQWLYPYFKGLQNAIFQQDNARPHVVRRVLTFLDAQGIWTGYLFLSSKLNSTTYLTGIVHFSCHRLQLFLLIWHPCKLLNRFQI